MLMKSRHTKPAPLQLFQDPGYHNNPLRQILLYKVKDFYMGGQSGPLANKQGKSKSIRFWLYSLHQKVAFLFLKQGSSGTRLAHAGFAPTCTRSFQLDMKERPGLMLDWSLDITLTDISWHLDRKFVPQCR